MQRVIRKVKTGLEYGLKNTRSRLPRCLKKYVGMPSRLGALWGRAVDRADAISSMEIDVNEDYSAGFANLGMYEISRWNERKKSGIQGVTLGFEGGGRALGGGGGGGVWGG